MLTGSIVLTATSTTVSIDLAVTTRNASIRATLKPSFHAAVAATAVVPTDAITAAVAAAVAAAADTAICPVQPAASIPTIAAAALATFIAGDPSLDL